MKFALSAAAIFFAVLAAGTPTQPPPSYHDTVYLTFRGATNDVHDKYEVAVPTDGSPVYPGNRLSVSYMTSYAGPDVKCTAYGIDGSKTVTNGAQTVPIGPPQTQISVKCKVKKY